MIGYTTVRSKLGRGSTLKATKKKNEFCLLQNYIFRVSDWTTWPNKKIDIPFKKKDTRKVIGFPLKAPENALSIKYW